jgi:alpha-L-rhamnosidase
VSYSQKYITVREEVKMNNKIYVAGQYFLNNGLKPDEVRKQVREIAHAGYQAIYGHARQGLETPYFSEEWWEIIKIIVDECRTNGMKFAIWDEDYFPSAVAGDRIIWNNPELTSQNIEFTIAEFKTTESSIELKLLNANLLKCYALPKHKSSFGEPIDITRHCGTVRTQWTKRQVNENAYSNTCQIGMPHWRTTMDEASKTYALKWKPEKQIDYLVIAAQIVTPPGRHNTDILNEKTIEEFVRYTHAEYAERFGNKVMSKYFHAAFMDEPAPGGAFPWTAKFVEEFINEHGYNIAEKLPHLAINVNEDTPLIRHHYRMTQMRLQCTNYLQQIQKWCHEHNIQSAGHLTRTEHLSYVAHAWPNELRCYKHLDIPCTDPLGAGIAWRDAAAYHIGLKVVSSASHIFGKEQAGSDALAVMGSETSLRDLKFSIDYQMVLGINYFNLHGLSYSFDGPRKDEVPPSLFYQHSQWQYMPALISYIKNTCETLSIGEHLCGTAMLYPSTSFYCKFNAKQSWNASELESKIHLLADDLLSHQKDFDLIDEVTISEQSNGKMPEDWQVIILPFLKFITADTAIALDKFIVAGGKVIVLGEIPQLLGNKLGKPIKKWQNQDLTFSKELTPEIISSLPGPELKGAGSENIFILRRINGDRIISFLFNRAERDFGGDYNGEAVTVPAKGSLLLDSAAQSPDPVQIPTKNVTLDSGWHVKFHENHIPLAIWQAKNDPNQPHVLEYNLLERQENPLEDGEIQVAYQSRFLYSGKAESLKIVFDKSAVKGDWKLLFNGVEIKVFKNERIYDCYNFSANLTEHIRTGSTPTENKIKILTQGKERGLFEMPYLYGNFTCEYRHAYRSLPFLQGCNKSIKLDALIPWKEIGYPTFSGTAKYSIAFDIAVPGEYHIDLGRVEDAADVFSDGEHIELLPWKPYKCKLGFLKKGNHMLTVKVSNGPGNHDRLAMLSAGLLGPVRLYLILKNQS